MFRIGSIFIPVTDLTRSLEWYQTYFYVSEIGRWEGGIGVHFPDGATQLGLIETKTVASTTFSDRNGDEHVSFNIVCDDIQSIHDTFEHAGLKPGRLQDFGGMRCFDVLDPDGNVISLTSESADSPFHGDQIRQAQLKGQTQ